MGFSVQRKVAVPCENTFRNTKKGFRFVFFTEDAEARTQPHLCQCFIEFYRKSYGAIWSYRLFITSIVYEMSSMLFKNFYVYLTEKILSCK